MMNRIRRKALKMLLLLSGLMAVAGCDPNALARLGNKIGLPISKGPIQVALLIPKSDQNAGLVAASLEKSARLAVADLKDIPIDLRVYDTAGQAGTASAQTQKAIAEGAQIVIGPLYAEAANAAGVAASQKNINVLSFSNNASVAGGNLFILGKTFENTAERMMQFAKKQGKRKAVIAHSNDVPGYFGRDAFLRASARNGIETPAVIGYNFSQPQIVASVPKIKTAVASTGADMLLFTSTTSRALPLFVQLLPESGLGADAVQYVGISTWDTPSNFLVLPGAQGAWFARPDAARVAAYSQRYYASYGSTPHELGGLAYDAIAAIGALVKSGHPQPLSRAALTQGAGFEGASGIFRLRPDGTNERGLAVAQIVNKQVVILEPAPKRFSGAGF